MPNSRRTPTARLDPREPLVLDTRTLPRRPGSARTETRTVPAPADLHTGLAGIPEGSDLRLDVTLESVTEGVLATVTAVAPVTGECARRRGRGRGRVRSGRRPARSRAGAP